MYLTIFKPHSQGGRRLYFTKSSQVFCVIGNLLLGANNIIKYIFIITTPHVEVVSYLAHKGLES